MAIHADYYSNLTRFLGDDWLAAFPYVEGRAGMTEQELIQAMARSIMCARPDGGCIVKNWQVEAKDNPHVGLALDQATAAMGALRAAGFALVPEITAFPPPERSIPRGRAVGFDVDLVGGNERVAREKAGLN